MKEVAGSPSATLVRLVEACGYMLDVRPRVSRSTSRQPPGRWNRSSTSLSCCPPDGATRSRSHPARRPTMSILARRLLAIHAAFATAGIPHAFGGAIALAYCTGEPRGTIDLDVNVFVASHDPDTALDALPRRSS